MSVTLGGPELSVICLLELFRYFCKAQEHIISAPPPTNVISTGAKRSGETPRIAFRLTGKDPSHL
jgi:hypothetical protein